MADSRHDSDGTSDGRGGSLLDQLPWDRLRGEAGNMLTALGEKAVSSAEDKLGGLTDRLNDITDSGGTFTRAAAEGGKAKMQGKSPVLGALKGGMSGLAEKATDLVTGGGGSGKGKGGKGPRVTNIVEEIDIGLPVRVVYNQWTEFQQFPTFMKKVESVDQADDDKIKWKAQVWWSHRTWESTIIEQVPDERIVWRSSGQKGYADGAVTFHELAPELTRVLMVLEYHPQGLFERTGNIWRAVGRRARLELKHFRRHVMTETILHPDDVEGWRGEIRDGDVVKTHEEALEEEEREREERGQSDEGEDRDDRGGEEPEYEDDYEEDERDDGEPEDEYDEGEPDEDEPEDEYDEGEPDEDEPDEGEPDEGEPEDEYDEGEPDEDEPDEDEPGEGEPEDEYDEGEPEDEQGEPADEYDEGEPEDEQGEPEDEYDEGEPEDDDEEPEDRDDSEQEPRSRRRSPARTSRRR